MFRQRKSNAQTRAEQQPGSGMYNYVCWMVNNDSHRFVYDRDAHQFTEIKYGRTVGRYNFTEFDQLVKDRGMVSEFSPYEFRIENE